MKFILIFGPQAVGKMTVGQELAKVTDMKLFHNHMTIEFLEPLFGFSPETWKLSSLFRTEIFRVVAKSNLKGLIFTYVWAFDQQEYWDFVNKTRGIFDSQGATTYFVELEADIKERLERNKSPHRLKQKPTKRNIEWSEYELKETMKKHRLNSNKGEIKSENYIKINNTDLDAREVAEIISEKFNL
ncbi:AAA family ATPase [Sporosarcina ureilytica]|uniref:Shikimate kinase n=1 Tax=Sporosarcina ureilytica TaxID=298596 RepID=A0A1D8JH09_9BACL|nr:AAA family ATPase [Sporosarcina ureilytica]AOV07978.1 shikimate kinase [Sporosarcina ureilytica]